MDGFGSEPGGKGECPGPQGKAVYQYVDPAQLAPIGRSQSSTCSAIICFKRKAAARFTAHQDLIAGSTIINQPQNTESLVDFPRLCRGGVMHPKPPMHPLTRTSLLVYDGSRKLKNEYHKGAVPVSHVSDDARSARRKVDIVEILFAA